MRLGEGGRSDDFVSFPGFSYALSLALDFQLHEPMIFFFCQKKSTYGSEHIT